MTRNVLFLKTRRAGLPEDADAPVVLTPHGFTLGPLFVAWPAVSEIRAWTCTHTGAREALLGFTVGATCVVVNETRSGFEALEAAMRAAFPATAQWRDALPGGDAGTNEVVLFRRSR